MSIFDENRRICKYCGDRVSDWDGSVNHDNGSCVKKTQMSALFVDKEVRQKDLKPLIPKPEPKEVKKEKRGLLVVYVNVGKLPPERAENYIERFAERFKDMGESLNVSVAYFASEGETRVEYIPM